MHSPILIAASLLCAAALAYALFVNRRYQLYKGRFVLDIPVEKAWELMSLRPGFPNPWVPGLVSMEQINKDSQDLASLFEDGSECFIRLIAQEPPVREECIRVSRSSSAAPLGDLVLSQMTLRSVADGTEVSLTYVIERRRLEAGLFRRLGYPFLIRNVASRVRAHLVRGRQGRRRAVRERPAHRSRPPSGWSSSALPACPWSPSHRCSGPKPASPWW
jgi:hypothetical protein